MEYAVRRRWLIMGWIRVDRSLLDNWIWTDGGAFDQRSAWVDLLLMAKYDGTPGEVNKSILALADRWKWSRDRVRRFLQKLERAEMCATNATTHKTTITIVNWAKYQDCRATDDTADRHQTSQQSKERNEERTTERKEAKERKQESSKERNILTNNNNLPPTGEGERVNNARVKKRNQIPPSVQDVADYVAEKGYPHVDPQQFVDFYQSKNWFVGKTKMTDWQAAVRGWNSRHESNSHGYKPKGRGASFFDLLEDDEL